MTKAKDIMSGNVVLAPSTMGIRELANLLTEKMLSGVPVVDDVGFIVGVVSATDIVSYYSHENKSVKTDLTSQPDYYLRDWHEALESGELQQFHIEEYDDPGLISEIMTPIVYEVGEDAPLSEIAEMMVKGQIHRVIVTNKGRVSGVVSSLDVLKAAAGSLD